MSKDTGVQFQTDQLLQRIQSCQGMIPIAVNTPDPYNVVWSDVGDYRFTEWKFRYSMEKLAAKQDQKQEVITPIDLLAGDPFLTDTLDPTGFIFHMSMCGSTLLARALAQSDHHIVINEGSPLNDNIWEFLTENWRHSAKLTDKNLSIYKNMVLAMGRRRTPDQNSYFIKFRSWNVLFIDFITKAFPGVPMLFIYRDPIEVLVSAYKRPPEGYVRFKGLAPSALMLNCSAQETRNMSHLSYCTNLYVRYLKAALNAFTENISYLNYSKLTKKNLEAILYHAFGYVTTPSQLLLMQRQFDFYSKDDTNTTHFTSDKEEKQKAATPEIKHCAEGELAELYSHLEQSDRNLNSDH